jgi:MFS family permease
MQDEPMKRLGTPFFRVAFAMIVGGMSTALISPLYPIYQEQWRLPVSQISLIYVIYMLGSLTGLLLFGRLSDLLGFRRVMRYGVILMLLSTLLTLLAWDVPSLATGRYLVGIAASMLTISGTVGLMQLSPAEARARVSMLTSVLIAFGFGLGPLLGGIVGQWLPQPLLLAYVPSLLLGALALAGLHGLPPAADGKPVTLRQCLHNCLPRLTRPEARDRGVFVLACGFPLLAFGVFGLYASLAPLFLERMVSWHGPIVGGAAITAILFTSAGLQVLCSRLQLFVAGAAGMLAMASSNGLMIFNFSQGSTVLFATGVLLTALGHGLSMMTGSKIVSRIAQPHNRSGLVATYWVAGYVGAIVPMMGMGWIADHWGMAVAVTGFCSCVVLASLTLGVLAARHSNLRGN